MNNEDIYKDFVESCFNLSISDNGLLSLQILPREWIEDELERLVEFLDGFFESLDGGGHQ